VEELIKHATNKKSGGSQGKKASAFAFTQHSSRLNKGVQKPLFSVYRTSERNRYLLPSSEKHRAITSTPVLAIHPLFHPRYVEALQKIFEVLREDY
jgi:hypothetical protein